jgi:hypothetical protein
MVTSSPLDWGLFLCLQGAFEFVLGACTGTLVFTAYRDVQGIAWVPLFLPVTAQSLTAGFAHVLVCFPVDGGTLVFMAGGLWGASWAFMGVPLFLRWAGSIAAGLERLGVHPFFTQRRKTELAKIWGYPVL